ncbi:hypothetical protein GF352_01895|nr:hypothetical protein [archaeon]
MKKVLCVCAKGQNRNYYLANYLRDKGYWTRRGGVEEGANPPITKSDVGWADVIVIVRERLVPLVKDKFDIRDKKLVVINVTDSKRLVPKKYQELSFRELNEKWTYPWLRKAINKHLPL